MQLCVYKEKLKSFLRYFTVEEKFSQVLDWNLGPLPIWAVALPNKLTRRLGVSSVRSNSKILASTHHAQKVFLFFALSPNKPARCHKAPSCRIHNATQPSQPNGTYDQPSSYLGSAPTAILRGRKKHEAFTYRLSLNMLKQVIQSLCSYLETQVQLLTNEK